MIQKVNYGNYQKGIINLDNFNLNSKNQRENGYKKLYKNSSVYKSHINLL